MAVMQTPHGRVIGLILKPDQPKPQPEAVKAEPVKAEVAAPQKTAPVRKPGRPTKK